MVWPTNKLHQWSLPNNQTCYQLYNDHNKTCTVSPQDGTTIIPHSAQQTVWKVAANNSLSPPFVHSRIVDSGSAVLCHSWVIWPFLTHENKWFICLQVAQPLYLCAGYSTPCAWSSHTGLAVEDHQRRQRKTKINANFKKEKGQTICLCYFAANPQLLLREQGRFKLLLSQKPLWFWTSSSILNPSANNNARRYLDFRLWKSYSWLTVRKVRTESTKQGYRLCTEPSLYLPTSATWYSLKDSFCYICICKLTWILWSEYPLFLVQPCLAVFKQHFYF